jgi:hypothetical protein
MKISGRTTDSMECRYNIVNADDLNMARLLLQNAPEGIENVTKSVTFS